MTLHTIAVVIPIKNESESLEVVLSELKSQEITNVFAGVDPSTTDSSREILTKHKIHWKEAKVSGYDFALQAGIDSANIYNPKTEAYLFMDAGNKYAVSCIHQMIQLVNNGATLVMASRKDPFRHMTFLQKAGNTIFITIVNKCLSTSLTDISPYRLILRKTFESLHMKPTRFRYPSESLVKCLALEKKVMEIPVVMRQRIGKSKVAGNARTSIRASFDILSALQFIHFHL